MKGGCPRVGYWCCDPLETYSPRKRRIQVARESQSQSPNEDTKTKPPPRSLDFQKFRASRKGASEVCRQAAGAAFAASRSEAGSPAAPGPGPASVDVSRVRLAAEIAAPWEAACTGCPAAAPGEQPSGGLRRPRPLANVRPAPTSLWTAERSRPPRRSCPLS